MKSTLNLVRLAEAAVKFSQHANEVIQCRQALEYGYRNWKPSSGTPCGFVVRGSDNWNEMLVATANEYRLLQNAKGRERRAKAKLLMLTNTLKVLG